MKSKRIYVALFVALLLAVASGTAWADSNKTVVNIAVTPQTSSGGVVPTVAGGSNEWKYTYPIDQYTSISDTMLIHVCTSTSNGTSDFSYILNLSFTTPAGNSTIADGLSFTGGTFTSDTCEDLEISLDTDPFNTVGGFQANFALGIDFSSTGGNRPVNTNPPGASAAGFHIYVDVTEAEPPSAITCFVTDSSFNFLVDCSGNTVNSGDGGRFTINANKKNIEVSTQPGQFYYNVLWTNKTGSNQTVTVTFVREGVNPQGAQAIHASVFPAFPDLTEFNFELVNDDIPSGSDDKLESVVVPDGATLWVDYHLEWAGLGGPSSGLPLTCGDAGENCFHVTADVTWGTDGEATCKAGACGYAKPK